jgi:hypothetical protein
MSAGRRVPQPWETADIIDNGHCCGCRALPVTLFRVSQSRYRCAACFERESGRPAVVPANAARYDAMHGRAR